MLEDLEAEHEVVASVLDGEVFHRAAEIRVRVLDDVDTDVRLGEVKPRCVRLHAAADVENPNGRLVRPLLVGPRAQPPCERCAHGVGR